MGNLKTRRLHKILKTELINYPSQVLIKEEKAKKIIKQKVKKNLSIQLGTDKKVKIVQRKIKVTRFQIYILYSGGSSIYKFGRRGKRKTTKHFAGKHRFAFETGKRKNA